MIVLALLVFSIGCWAVVLVAAEVDAREQERQQARYDAALAAHGRRLKARIHVLCQARVRAWR